MPCVGHPLVEGGVKMLALSDKALCRILIAGTGIEPDAQAGWLENIAERLEAPAEKSKHQRGCQIHSPLAPPAKRGLDRSARRGR